MTTQEVTIFRPNEAVVQQMMPVFSPALALQRYQVMKEIIEGVLHEGVDFGKIPGTDKATLLKPGAEKLCTAFGLVPKYEYEQIIEDWGDAEREPLFAYRIKCSLWRNDYKAGEGMGYCSSRESKYRWRWVDDKTVELYGLDKAKLTPKRASAIEFEFAIQKAENSGQYGKPPEYWEKWKAAIQNGRARKITKPTKNGDRDAWIVEVINYRIPNPDVADQINTVLKMAMKRAYVAATISAANVSDRFTQDVEDYTDVEYESVPEKPIDTGGHPVGTQEAANYVRDKKLEEIRKEQQPTTVSSQAVSSAGSTATVTTSGATQSGDYGVSPRNGPVGPAVPQDTHATPPPTGNGRVAPQELQNIWAQMTKMEGRIAALNHQHELLQRYKSEDEANDIFFGVLAKYNKSRNAVECSKLASTARQAVWDLYEITKPLTQQQTVAAN